MVGQNLHIWLKIRYFYIKILTEQKAEMRKILAFIAILVMVTSCNTINFSDQPQGIIEYEVIYLTNKSGMPTNLLPRKVVLKFRSNKSITTIEGFMGLFSLSNISDFRKHTNSILLKVMDNKLVYEGKKNEPPFFLSKYFNSSIAITSETKTLAGLSCYKAIISVANNKEKKIVYFTQAIPLKNANKASPFASIDGILMEFDLSLNNIEMHLKATKYTQTEVDASIFKVDDSYREVSQRKITSILNKLLE